MNQVPITRRIWFYWTLIRLACFAFIVLGIIAGCAYLSYDLFRSRQFAGATAMLAVSLALALFIFMRAVIFRWHVHTGIRRELRRRNCCPNCEYDLRASALRCPECGHPLPTPNIEV